MNLILRPSTAPLSKFVRSTSLKTWHPRRGVGAPSSSDLQELDQAQTRTLFKTLEGIDPLKVTSYGRASQLESTVTWRHVQLSPGQGLADCGAAEMTFRFDAWRKAVANLSPQLASPGLYIYGSTGSVLASLVLRDLHALPQFRTMLPQRRLDQVHYEEPGRISRPIGPVRRPGPHRLGYGPRTHKDSRAFVIADRYALGRGEHIDLQASHRCARLETSELLDLFNAIYEQDMELSLLNGPSSFWQLHKALVRPSVGKDQRLVLRGARCQLEVALPRICEAWVVRAQHRGEFVYAVLFYDHTLKLDAAAILPPSTMACSVSDWKSLVQVVGAAQQEH